VCILTSRDTRDDVTSRENHCSPCHLPGRKNREMLDLFTANAVLRSRKKPVGRQGIKPN
jgi:hypothetical protein